ncbi:uncharacterized protein B0P05DRAFT_443310, partial [Gilbertella persicaria]|uniref:uncharacterized protein n=1 Tax=Gilbertella persicaria TaxID=101096 RepID=UPI00221F1BE7
DFPNCTFYGFDLLDIFEEGQGILIPNNCRLKKHDVFDGLAYKDNTFDFVHQRMMHLVYPQDKIPWLFEEILRVTKDNGWVELIEPDLSPKRCGPLFEKVYNAVRITIKELFGSPLHGPSLVKRMSEAGLVDIQTDYGSLPVCWGGYIGKLVYENALQGFRVFGPAIFEHLELEGEFDSESFDDLLDKAFDECVEYQTFFNIRWAYGRK